MSTAPHAVYAEKTGLLLDVLTADSAQDRKNQEALKELYRTMQNIPWRPSSVVSLHPWQLVASGSIHNELRIPPASPADDDRFHHIELPGGRKLGFSHHVFPNWARNAKPNDAGALEFSAIMPLDLALDFIGQHQNFQRQGGLIAYEGDKSPLDVDPMENAFTYAMPTGGRPPAVPFKEALEAAHETQVNFYRKMYDAAEEAWAKPDKKGLHIITPNVRKATTLLRAWGYLESDPAWLKKVHRSGANAPVPVACKSCGAESKPGALRCTNGSCTYVFDPFGAFANLVIDLDTMGARLALRRLSEEQVNRLVNEKIFDRDQVDELLGTVALASSDDEAKPETKPKGKKATS